MIGIIWLAILYIKNQRGTLIKSTKQSTIEVGLVNETTSDSSPPSTIQRESETLKRHLMQPPNCVIDTPQMSPESPNGTPVYWSASQLLDNNNLVLQSRGVNATLDPISEEIDDMEDSNDSTSDRGKLTKFLHVYIEFIHCYSALGFFLRKIFKQKFYQIGYSA